MLSPQAEFYRHAKGRAMSQTAVALFEELLENTRDADTIRLLPDGRQRHIR
jgi:hypothetical protein